MSRVQKSYIKFKNYYIFFRIPTFLCNVLGTFFQICFKILY